MPHSNNNETLNVGDRVTVECVVTHVGDNDYGCDCLLRTLHPATPDSEGTLLALYAEQVDKVLPQPPAGE